MNAANGVLTNDTDPDGDTLEVVAFCGASQGTLDVAPDGSSTYEPDVGTSGDDTVVYTMSDGSGYGIGGLTITVGAPDVSVAIDDFHIIRPNQVLSVDAERGVLANDAAASERNLTVLSFQQAASGTVNMATDGTDTTQAKLNLAVINVAPVANDDSYTARPGRELDVGAEDGLLANDTDADGDPLRVR